MELIRVNTGRGLELKGAMFGDNSMNTAVIIMSGICSNVFQNDLLYATGKLLSKNNIACVIGHAMDATARYELRQKLNKQRTEDFKNGYYAKGSGLPDKLTGEEPQFVKDYWEYYKTPRGFHKRSINSNGNWNMTSALSFMTMPILCYSDEIQNAVLMIHGENAHSRYFSEDVFKKLKGDNKELYIVKGANHTDLYDKKIPFDKIEMFFKEYLK